MKGIDESLDDYNKKVKHMKIKQGWLKIKGFYAFFIFVEEKPRINPRELFAKSKFRPKVNRSVLNRTVDNERYLYKISYF